MKRIALWLCLTVPAILGIAVALELMGAFSIPYWKDASSAMHPLAAIGWGCGVYMICLTVCGIGMVFWETVKGKH